MRANTVRRLTRKQIERQIIDTVAKSISYLALGDPVMVRKVAKKVVRSLISGKKKEIEAYRPFLIERAASDALHRILKRRKFKTCTEEELKLGLAQFESYMQGVPSALRKGLDEMKRNLPRQGGPGRKEILNTAEKREACEQIGMLHKMGKIKKWPDIFEAVAEIFTARGKKVRARTIKRVWESRETLYIG